MTAKRIVRLRNTSNLLLRLAGFKWAFWHIHLMLWTLFYKIIGFNSFCNRKAPSWKYCTRVYLNYLNLIFFVSRIHSTEDSSRSSTEHTSISLSRFPLYLKSMLKSGIMYRFDCFTGKICLSCLKQAMPLIVNEWVEALPITVMSFFRLVAEFFQASPHTVLFDRATGSSTVARLYEASYLIK